ncbi:hypothetical protein M2322_000919 [Rhodoblastus acidophilus]|uniref:hypothetical protein n=1 Tax=Rhodoblastus acidophilus TaxID=1074 RepID=UPI0022240A57|nr:hypothetical protein [Rhodoblastus acidophilus]MCW2315385.1 hypothetical protein [Rhodoblastus acidophilus]
MTCERQIVDHLERALVETMFAIAEFDHLRAESTARGETKPLDTLAGLLAMLRSALDSALSLTQALTPQPSGYSLASPDNSR